MMNLKTISGDLSAVDSEPPDPQLAESITKAASKQTYYTIRLLVDRDRVADAFRAYSYFRWVDDWLDQGGREKSERLAFARRQSALIDQCYRGEIPELHAPEERLLLELIGRDHQKSSGLEAYIQNMMAVMSFDAERKGRLITYAELTDYTHWLAKAVTEALHTFIGERCRSPQDGTRYLAVTAAHITHMLRDTLDDTRNGYYNIPKEYLSAQGIHPEDVSSEAYRKWVRDRVNYAQACFKIGIGYLRRVENPRCRLAGYAYTARFTSVLDAIEQDDYWLRPVYPASNGISVGLKMSRWVLSLALRRRPLNDLEGAWQAR